MVLAPTFSVLATEPVQVGRPLETSENGRRDWTTTLSLRTKLIAWFGLRKYFSPLLGVLCIMDHLNRSKIVRSKVLHGPWRPWHYICLHVCTTNYPSPFSVTKGMESSAGKDSQTVTICSKVDMEICLWSSMCPCFLGSGTELLLMTLIQDYWT